MQKAIKKWALINRNGTIVVPEKKPVIDKISYNNKEITTGYYYDTETNAYYEMNYWDIKMVEIKICKEQKNS